MTIDIDYRDVAGMPDLVHVDIAANFAGGICRLEARGTGQPRDLFMAVNSDCQTTVTLSSDVRRADIPEGIDAFASICPDESIVPDLTNRLRACREGSSGMLPQRHRDPPPPAPNPPATVTRCPTAASGDCTEDRVCMDALGAVAAARESARLICLRQIENDRERALIRGALIALFVVWALLLIACIIASIFGSAAAAPLVAAVFAVTVTLVALGDQERQLGLLFYDLIELAHRAQLAHQAALHRAAGACICPGCAVRPSDAAPLTCP